MVFWLPGAFTPTCSSKQLPGFESNYAAYNALGVADIYCVSVNDAFVMYQSGQHQGLNNVKLLPDGNGDFKRRLGMLIDKRHLGFGMRSWRYAAVVDDGKIAAWFEEPGINDAGTDTDPYEQSTPENILAWLQANPKLRSPLGIRNPELVSGSTSRSGRLPGQMGGPDPKGNPR